MRGGEQGMAVMVDDQRLGQVFVELADTLVTDFDVVEFMTMLAHRVVELLGAREAGVVLADERGLLRSVASSHESAHLLDLFELQNQEGPCLDCYRTGQPILNQSLASPDNHWPNFAAEAERLGFTMVHALPMRLRGQVIGAVNIFASNATALTPSQIDIGQALADVATVGLLQERSLREARLLNEQLQGALNSRIVIEQAKGMLAERRGIEMDAAFDILRAHARGTNQKLSAVAQALLAGTLSAEALGRR
jgi:transcriptional regulator with GAF, ATPase, and Fis domain